jgi:hypothetical protein
MSLISPCGADTLVREPLKAKTNRKKVNEVRAGITRSLAVFMAALREIFEESAYERFLSRRSLTSSPAAYGDFLRETEAAKARRPRCC